MIDRGTFDPERHRGRSLQRSEVMSSEYFLITGGYVYDPANGIDGQVKDLWISGGKIVEPPTRSRRCGRRER